MKNIFAISTIFLSLFSNAQVIIGDNKGTASNKNSVLLEFAENSSTEKNNKGLILPYVSSLPSLPAGGTILLHTSNNGTESRMKYYNGNQWVDLSTRDADVSKDLEIQKGKVCAVIKLLIALGFLLQFIRERRCIQITFCNIIN